MKLIVDSSAGGRDARWFRRAGLFDTPFDLGRLSIPLNIAFPGRAAAIQIDVQVFADRKLGENFDQLVDSTLDESNDKDDCIGNSLISRHFAGPCGRNAGESEPKHDSEMICPAPLRLKADGLGKFLIACGENKSPRVLSAAGIGNLEVRCRERQKNFSIAGLSRDCGDVLGLEERVQRVSSARWGWLPKIESI